MFVERRVQLTFPPNLLNQPLIWELIRRFDVLTNIHEARVTAEEGWLILTVRGTCEMVQQSLDWIASQGVQVEVLSETEEETCAS